MNLALWITSGLLAAVALVGGSTKTFLPKAKLAAAQGGGWTENVEPGLIKALGILELLAAPGLILPVALDIAPVLTRLTAVCWILLMLGAMATHGRRREFPLVGVNVVYLALAVFVAWKR